MSGSVVDDSDFESSRLGTKEQLRDVSAILYAAFTYYDLSTLWLGALCQLGRSV